MKAAFHLALPCDDIQKTKEFYVDILGANKGRGTNTWIDIDFYGNQVTFTNAGSFNFDFKNYRLSGQILPSFHFGVIVDMETWGKIYTKLFSMDIEVTTEVTFLENKAGEHISFFVTDPDGYQVEFKSFKNEKEIFTSI
ncbi:VOC family protein [Kordia algicida OT-1]|uniref:VOC domain-containing protein n=1 Tax=Kordia algicida OT-1 TaxID=391587 RepID=A9DYZ0_9FLAO|nr:VOC family protein [Kordia algicida]EDP96198.1 hypothetical protein KAOT1_08513 [Kordia algicida OT-1]